MRAVAVPEEASAAHFLEDARTFRRPSPASEPVQTPDDVNGPREGDDTLFDVKYYSRDVRRWRTDEVRARGVCVCVCVCV